MSEQAHTDYECGDCGRDDHLSINAMLNCPCDKYDRNGRLIDTDLVHPFTD